MGVGDTPSIKRMREQVRGMQSILRINRALRFLGCGSNKMEEARQQLINFQAQLKELESYTDRFNDYFAKDGWLVHGSMDFDVLKRAVDQFEMSGPTAGVKVLLDYFSPASIQDRLLLLKGVGEFRIRDRLIKLAFEDYRDGRFHAVVPVLLMMIDGAINDAIGKGLHSEGVELEVWDSITTVDGSINVIKSIFQRGRRKTRTQRIDVPYRNGILHGMDLGYDNEIVAAKCWCFVFVVAEWITAKRSEVNRQARFEEEGRIPSWRELADQIAANKRARRKLKTWQPRNLDSGYMRDLNEELRPEEGAPEATAIRFLQFWSQRNYGEMSKLYWVADNPGSGRHAGEVRMRLSDWAFSTYYIESISDEAPAITEVTVVLDRNSDNPRNCKLRLLYETTEGEVLVRGMAGAEWRVIWVQVDTTKGNDNEV